MSNQPNSYEPYGYDHYDQAPRSGAYAQGLAARIIGPAVGAAVRNPLVATAALLLTGAAFAGIIVASYPDSPNDGVVPVIKAETTPFKGVPDDRGGMDVPHQDSTIFMSMGDGRMAERPPVENLLEQEDVVDKAEAFARESEQEAQAAAAEPAAGAETTEITASETPPPEAAAALKGGVETSTNEAAAKTADVVASATSAQPKVEIQKIIADDDLPPADDGLQAAAEAPKPQSLHAPASSPETIAYVRSVLDQKDAEAKGAPSPSVSKAQEANIAATSAAEAAKDIEPITRIEPAAGAAVPAVGNFFVQVGSVKTRDGAASEWSKIQKAYTGLQGFDYRVQEANLGERGTFYRIQAGPTSKENANAVCDAIKAQKPGGCLVVSK